MANGVIYKAMSGFYYVEVPGGTVQCRARGRFRLENTKPLVGDYVEFTQTEKGYGLLTAVLPRKNSFIRPPIANIDILVIIASGVIPVTDPFLIDRMTAVAHKNGCESVICVNKCDLDPAEELFEIYSASGYTTIRTSAETGEGLSELSDVTRDKMCAFTGNSGVGKSSILNMLDSGFQIDTGDVSKKLGRGRHTTRHVELYKLENGAVIADTPGFASFDTELELTEKENVQRMFPDFEAYLDGCRFLDCAHINEPGCAVLAALTDGRIQKTRHESYVRLYEQAKSYKEWENKQK